MSSLRKTICTASILLSTFFPFNNEVLARSEYWEQKVSLFDELPISFNDIVFLGNSITDGGEFAEIFDNISIKNRGISGDVISGVRERLHQVTDNSPRKIFLLIGINDISHNLSPEKLAKEYDLLVKEIIAKSPATKLYIQSVMPINNDFGRYKNLIGKEKVVTELNNHLKKIAAANNVTFIDLFPILSDSDGKMKRAFTNDGLHLTGKGYKAWTDFIKNFVEE